MALPRSLPPRAATPPPSRSGNRGFMCAPKPGGWRRLLTGMCAMMGIQDCSRSSVHSLAKSIRAFRTTTSTRCRGSALFWDMNGRISSCGLQRRCKCRLLLALVVVGEHRTQMHTQTEHAHDLILYARARTHTRTHT